MEERMLTLDTLAIIKQPRQRNKQLSLGASQVQKHALNVGPLLFDVT